MLVLVLVLVLGAIVNAHISFSVNAYVLCLRVRVIVRVGFSILANISVRF